MAQYPAKMGTKEDLFCKVVPPKERGVEKTIRGWKSNLVFKVLAMVARPLSMVGWIIL